MLKEHSYQQMLAKASDFYKQVKPSSSCHGNLDIPKFMTSTHQNWCEILIFHSHNLVPRISLKIPPDAREVSYLNTKLAIVSITALY